MGNCFGKSKKSISPSDSVSVSLHGPSGDLLTAYIRFALLHKSVPLRFVPSETPRFGTGSSPVLRVGSETVSGSREAMLRYIDERFPNPPLPAAVGGGIVAAPAIVAVAALQHRSLSRHLGRMVTWAGDLATRGRRRTVDPAMGSTGMEVKKFGRSYSQLLEVMLEHAQMEERVIFPILEMADRGLCKAANEEHARDLPIMNGIKEDIKSIGVLDSGGPAYKEAFSSLLARLKSLRGHCKEHFEEEEKEVLPLLEVAELTKEKEERAMEQCMEVMRGTHSHLLHFLMEGLLPREALQYLDLIASCTNKKTNSLLGLMGYQI